MDFVKDNAGSMGCVGQLISCICGCGMLAAVITLTVYFGIFALNNPD